MRQTFLASSSEETPYYGLKGSISSFRIGSCQEDPCKLIEREDYVVNITLTMREFIFNLSEKYVLFTWDLFTIATLAIIFIKL